ncbi:MAG: prolyl aminopeptidase [Gammaproteobacteria bacterium]|nr:prolyl aminopeptidase [Gammaproteobacteria bacterium]
MRSLYPAIQPYRQFTLPVTSPHVLYVEECGNPDGVPVVFLHGGPGAGCEPYHRSFFNPQKYRIVLFDQRGCGKSTPHAELHHNSTWDLVADLELLREQLQITQWVVFGGSWGSTLALAYAQTHPQRVMGLILRGIFLCRRWEIDWFYQAGGASRIFPDYWQAFTKPIPENEQTQMVAAYYQRLTCDDELIRMQAAKAWSIWEGRTATLRGSKSVIDHFAHPHTALSLARIECHYFMHGAFLQENQLLRDAPRLAKIPAIIVQGRYDIVCPLQSAWDLQQAYPFAELQIISDAGHSAAEPGISAALLHATDQMLSKIK